MKRYWGRGAAPGIAIGPALVWQPEPAALKNKDASGNPQEERARLEAAVEAAAAELKRLKIQAEEEIGVEEGQIFEAQLLMLADPALVGAALEAVSQGESAATALAAVVEEQAALLEQLADEYLAERAADVRDVGEQIQAHLRGEKQGLPQLKTPSILVAKELTPSLTARLTKKHLLGFVTEAGGSTSHVAIMARSLGIPAVVALEGIVDQIDKGQLVALDGASGEVEIGPTAMGLSRWKKRRDRQESKYNQSLALASEPALTVDGHPVTLMANIGHPAEVQLALDLGAKGVGLFRTEFLYMGRQELPSEDEQAAVYREVAAAMAPGSVIIRTLDIGGDKDLPYLGLEREPNPFLGWRGLRYSLSRPEIFRTQLRAILRAAASAKNIKIMLPLVVSIEEIKAAKVQLLQAGEELDRRKIPWGRQVQLGIMVETPAAAVIAAELAAEVDFFSIGSNDLVQYTLAADRHNERVEKVFDPFHPAVLRLLADILSAGRKAKIEVGLCGELAGEPKAAPLLLGLGLDIFSMAAPSLQLVKEKIRSCSFSEAQSLAQQALSLPSGTEVRALLDYV